MSERSTGMASLLAAAIVTIAGLVPVIWLLSSPSETSVVPEDVAVVTTTTATVPATTVYVEPVPPLDVAGLDPAVARVLQANGYAEKLGEAGLQDQLPDAVVRVLIDHDAVLTVVEDGPTSGGN
jgi:hypothetical protein